MNFTSLQQLRVRLCTTGLVPAVCLAAGLAGCGGGGTSAGTVAETSVANLSAKPTAFWGSEDQVLTGVLAYDASGPGTVSSFVIVQPPLHGRLNVEPQSGAFTYQPDPDFFGEDSFVFKVRRDQQESGVAEVRLSIAGVNDAPQLQPIPDLANSAYESTVVWRLEVEDPDEDELTVSTANSREDVVEVRLGADQRSLELIARSMGLAEIEVSVSDGVEEVAQTFEFHVERQVRVERLSLPDPSAAAIRIVNTAPDQRRFVLAWNDFRLHEDLDSVLDQARQERPAGDGLSLPFQLWKHVRGNAYHHYSMSGERWEHDPLVLLNSIGFGLCDDVAVALALLVQHAGYEARVWSLNGHVVPEVQLDGRWSILDPDIDITYLNRDGTLAGVAELEVDPTLVTDPTSPVSEPVSAVYGYQPFIADIYASADDNAVEPWYLEGADRVSGAIELPGGARLEFPGKWVSEVQDSNATMVPAYSTARMIVPAGYTGSVPMPLVLRAVNGVAQLEILGTTFDSRDGFLNEWLATNRYRIPTVDIRASETEIELVMLLNPIRSQLSETTEVQATGPRVADLEFESIALTADERVPAPEDIPVFPPAI